MRKGAGRVLPAPSKSLRLGSKALGCSDLPMIVAVVTVRVVQVTVDQVVDVIAVRNGFMAAARPVLVALVVSAAVMPGGAVLRVHGIHVQLVLIHMIAVDMVQMPVMQVIRVAVVLDRGVPAAGAVLVVVVRVLGAGAHQVLLGLGPFFW